MLSEQEQQAVCAKYAVKCVAVQPWQQVGISPNVSSDLKPLNGLRHEPVGDSSGWYIWAGEDLSADPDFFQPLHASHLEESCPAIVRYLGLPPGWRFLIADSYEDVWFDESLLKVSRKSDANDTDS